MDEKTKNQSFPPELDSVNSLNRFIHIKPSCFIDYRLYLYTLYKSLKAKNGGYTYKRFASDIGIGDQRELKDVILGTGDLTYGKAKIIAEKIGLPEQEMAYLAKLIMYSNTKDSPKSTDHLADLIKIKLSIAHDPVSKEQDSYFAHWFIPVIGEMANLEGFQPDPEWISQHLLPKIPREQVEKCLKVLERVGILKQDPITKKYERSERDLSTSEDADGKNIARFHREMIDLGKRAIQEVAPNKREISSLLVSVSEATFHKIKTLIHSFENQVLNEEGDSKERDQLYQLNIQFFPVSEQIKKKRGS